MSGDDFTNDYVRVNSSQLLTAATVALTPDQNVFNLVAGAAPTVLLSDATNIYMANIINQQKVDNILRHYAFVDSGSGAGLPANIVKLSANSALQ